MHNINIKTGVNTNELMTDIVAQKNAITYNILLNRCYDRKSEKKKFK